MCVYVPRATQRHQPVVVCNKGKLLFGAKSAVYGCLVYWFFLLSWIWKHNKHIRNKVHATFYTFYKHRINFITSPITSPPALYLFFLPAYPNVYVHPYGLVILLVLSYCQTHFSNNGLQFYCQNVVPKYVLTFIYFRPALCFIFVCNCGLTVRNKRVCYVMLCYKSSHRCIFPRFFGAHGLALQPLKSETHSLQLSELVPVLTPSVVTLRRIMSRVYLALLFLRFWLTQIVIAFPCAHLWITFYLLAHSSAACDVVQFRWQRWRRLRQRQVRRSQQQRPRRPPPKVPTHALQGGPTKWGHKLMAIILPNLDRV